MTIMLLTAVIRFHNRNIIFRHVVKCYAIFLNNIYFI